jgi:hypothetical protein
MHPSVWWPATLFKSQYLSLLWGGGFLNIFGGQRNSEPFFLYMKNFAALVLRGVKL